jgi:hypothetical protein
MLDLMNASDVVFDGSNPWGLAPSEAAAAFVCIDSEMHPELASLGKIIATSLALDNEQSEGTSVIAGRGLSSAIRGALEIAVPHRIITDLNGNRDRAAELGFALSSNSDGLGELVDQIETPITQTGDCGIANSLVHLALSLAPALNADDDNSERSQISYVISGNPTGEKAVAIVESAPANKSDET